MTTPEQPFHNQEPAVDPVAVYILLACTAVLAYVSFHYLGGH